MSLAQRVVRSAKWRVARQVERRHASSLGDDRFLLVTLDSCRFDVFADARTPELDSRCVTRLAQSSASYTYPAHQSFFVGQFPNCPEPVPYYNRFVKQLVGLIEVGEEPRRKDTYRTVQSDWNIVDGFRRAGLQTIGAGAMNWFRQRSLTSCFEKFRFLRDADDQIDFVTRGLRHDRGFFAFCNFGETHEPYRYRGKTTPPAPKMTARQMTWPPLEQRPVGRETEAYHHQVEALEFLDRRLAVLFELLPPDTIVVVCGDHGECFGEDGYWGHGVSHPKVFDVPLGIFRLDGRAIE